VLEDLSRKDELSTRAFCGTESGHFAGLPIVGDQLDTASFLKLIWVQDGQIGDGLGSSSHQARVDFLCDFWRATDGCDGYAQRHAIGLSPVE
jgi:hypothetical protein